MSKGYCPSCDSIVPEATVHTRHDGPMKCCARCENLMVYETVQDFIDAEHTRVMRVINCDHRFEKADDRRSYDGRCDYCQHTPDSELVQYAQQR